MGSSTRINRIVGILGIFFAILTFVPVLTFEENKLILVNHTFFFVRYFKLILLLNGSVLFLTLGVLFHIGLLVPLSTDKYEKAKLHLIGAILSTPTWLSLSIFLFVMVKHRRECQKPHPDLVACPP